MKNTKICPKCASNDIIKIKGNTGNSYSSNFAAVGLLSYVPVTRYVCCNCVFSEEWIENEKDIEKLKKKHSKNNVDFM